MPRYAGRCSDRAQAAQVSSAPRRPLSCLLATGWRLLAERAAGRGPRGATARTRARSVAAYNERGALNKLGGRLSICRRGYHPRPHLYRVDLFRGPVQGVVVAESVELATVLFVDLVGSTRMATSVGPGRADELREEYFSLLREAVSSSQGREVKNLGDGLMVAFPSASAGVGCAVFMQQLFERRYRSAEQQLHVRIGLGTGESTVKDGDYFGMPTIEAARLCDKAPPDGILVSPGTRLMAGRIDGARFESAGELELKGIPEPVEAFGVVWEPLADEAGSVAGGWPLPSLLRAVPRMAYVGRVTERALLEESRGLARAGSRQVALLSGEPGIGKTRLALFSALGAHADGFGVCWGACSEDLAAPYEPWIAVCSQIVEHLPQDALASYVERFGGEVGRIARNLSQRVPDAPAPAVSDPETERFLLFQAVAELMRTAAGAQALCVVLDDFHWADGQSVALLKHVARAVEQGALQILVTYRDSDLGKDHSLTGVLADLRRLDGVERIGLTGLEVQDVQAMAMSAAGHNLDADGVALMSEIAAETGGNPFFVSEILRNLLESGMVVFDEESGRWRVDRSSGVTLPESVREVVERRIGMLGERARELLTAAAVIGRSFEIDLLAKLVVMGEGELLDELEAAVAASLLSESSERVGRFSFEHALINHTLYEGLGATRRARIHLRIAEAIEELYGTDSDDQLAELALHWRLATVSVEMEKAARYSLRAGQRALDSLAPAEAARLFGDALELTGTAPSLPRCEALIGLGEAQHLTGDPAYRETLLDACAIATTLEDADLAARAALANSRGIVSVIGEVDQPRIDAIERALELDERSQPARRARLLALEAVELTWVLDPGRRRALADEAIALARDTRYTRDPRMLAEVLQNACYAYWSADTLQLRAALVSELLASATAAQDPALLFWAHAHDFNFRVESGEFERAHAALKRQQAVADELGQPTLSWVATYHAAAWAQLRGELETAEQLAGQALQIGQEAGQPDAAFVYAACLVDVRLLQGRGQELVAMVEQSVAAYPAIIAWRANLAKNLCWLDRHAEAALIVRDAAEDRFACVHWETSRLTVLALFAEAASMSGELDAVAILYELIEPYGDQVVWTSANGFGHASMYLGLLAAALGRHEQADEQFAIATEFNEANQLPVWAARTHLGWAEALARRGERDRARQHAERTLELSREHGYGLFEPRGTAILATAVPTHR